MMQSRWSSVPKMARPIQQQQRNVITRHGASTKMLRNELEESASAKWGHPQETQFLERQSRKTVF